MVQSWHIICTLCFYLCVFCLVTSDKVLYQLCTAQQVFDNVYRPGAPLFSLISLWVAMVTSHGAASAKAEHGNSGSECAQNDIPRRSNLNVTNQKLYILVSIQSQSHAAARTVCTFNSLRTQPRILPAGKIWERDLSGHNSKMVIIVCTAWLKVGDV